MQVETRSGHRCWLAYGMNVHPGGDLAAFEQALQTVVPGVREGLGNPERLGLALRFDAATVERLIQDPDQLAGLATRLADEGLVPFTGNAFVLGAFHGQAIKDGVYSPPWGHPARTRYTLDFARVLAGLAPDDVDGLSLSTAPGAWRGWQLAPDHAARSADAMASVAAGLAAIEAETGKCVRVGVEPEPRCTLETMAELVHFFDTTLRPRLAAGHEKYLGVCYDVCHQAVMHEDPDAALDALLAAEIPIVKVQASSALELRDPADPAGRAALAAFDEPVYLHQVSAPDAAGLVHVAEDLAGVLNDPSGRWLERKPWRVHFHVPVFREALVPPLHSTQADLVRVLRRVAVEGLCPHVEVETYTFDVLPAAERRAGSGEALDAALIRELRWTRDHLVAAE